VATAALVAAGAPAVAQAADAPTVNWANSDYDNDFGTLLVSATAPSGIATIRAHIVTWETQQEVAVTDAFTLREGTVADGVWASAPILLDQLGTYRVHVEVTDTDGTQVRRDNAGDLFYAVATFFDGVTLNRTTVTYEKRTVTAKGTLKGRWPGSSEVKPLGGFPPRSTATSTGMR
jgi:hypothetical protein